MEIHIVREGETLSQISGTYNISIQEIMRLNDLRDANHLVIGQSIVIPASDGYYTVMAGDTLWKIAQRYKTTVDALVQRNKITNPSLIYPGLLLRIPTVAVNYTIKPGETLWQIAQKNNTTVQALADLNKISNPNLIYPGTSIRIPAVKPRIEVNAYTYAEGQEENALVREVGQELTYISPFAYGIRSDGGLNQLNDEAAIKTALSENVLPMMCISNFTSIQKGSDIAHTILVDPALQTLLLDNIINVMKSKGYRGLNIDFENVYQGDRELYNHFIQYAVERLHPEGFFVSTALAPKLNAGQKGLLYEAHDYAAHGRIADFVILMTYEWGYRAGPPQAISPLNQIKGVLDYAVSEIPKNKIFFGFQIYARDWVVPHIQGQVAETFSHQEAVSRALKYKAAIQYDSVAESPFYRYVDERGVNHEVWFEDARSAQAKFDTVKEYNLRGISYWVLGYPFTQNWELLEANFDIIKKH
ncbi:putative glycosyl hydrolase [Desulfosporosinus orientis DSM 765]|uniref:Putative glycosyl hydrolase n=1 Tax=Desulfosporosinus orientis (strain ATCC 19365 / DSM 765 / NCIMB 8382 / VKM B-1628 / Singapore I) TaxID=768706 RepID=G7WDJ7_DESOD|nr:LysM peptidoglycan-binding domain-containing protein [Desulfosporosinus orientis]AET68322.1 putative glycosyl hydrolase [Desulfosporosinus orientis DSM 765]